VHAFYESVGLMIGAEGDERRRSEYLMRLMAWPNSVWAALMQQASRAPARGPLQRPGARPWGGGGRPCWDGLRSAG
jgi:hypothetical protein